LGVDLGLIHPGDEDRNAAVLYVGRLLPEKGVDVLLRSIVDVDGVSLDIIGAGPEEDPLRRLAGDLGIADRVRFRGFVGPEDLPSAYRRAMVVVVPSLPTPSWTEQFCRVAVEAMACGTPVLTSDAGALPEVVGDAGMHFAAGDAIALAAGLRRLSAEPDLREVLGRSGVRRAQDFSWSAVAAHHAAVYAGAAGR
jgi:glycosyltransferase involved in cell wall biosynthesis